MSEIKQEKGNGETGEDDDNDANTHLTANPTCWFLLYSSKVGIIPLVLHSLNLVSVNLNCMLLSLKSCRVISPSTCVGSVWS